MYVKPGVPEVFSGWSNGTFTVRRQENGTSRLQIMVAVETAIVMVIVTEIEPVAGAGEVIFKDTMNSPVAGILSADYRMDGKEEGF